jgi:hypothetical protein
MEMGYQQKELKGETMQLIIPKQPTIGEIDTDATATTETEWTTGTYSLGTKRYKDMILYEVQVASTSNAPPHADWKVVEYINPYRCFDTKQGSQTSGGTDMTISITPTGSIINSVALLNVDAETYTLTVTDSVEGVVYTKTEQLLEDVTSWYEYFFAEYDQKTDVVLTDLPNYTGVEVTLELSRTAGSCLLGEFVVGQAKTIGNLYFGATFGIVDYSRKTVDEFGNYVVEERNYTKTADYPVQIETSALSAVQKLLAKVRATPCVWVGDNGISATITYGFFKDFALVLSNPVLSECSITVEGL